MACGKSAGNAQAVRVNLFKGVHVKTVQSRRDRALLTGRKLLITQNRQIENHLRGNLKAFGIKIGATTRTTFAAV
jgi:transposase